MLEEIADWDKQWSKKATWIHRCFFKLPHVCPNNWAPSTYVIFWLWVTDDRKKKKRKIIPSEFSNGLQENFKTGRIWSSAIIKNRLRCIRWPATAPGRMPRPCMGALIQLQTCFSHVAVTPYPSLWDTDTRLKLLMVARPICSRHQGTCFPHGALQQLEICHVETGGHGKDGPATPPAFDRSTFAGLPVTRRTWVLRAQSAPFNASSLYPSSLSNMSTSSSSLLSRPVMIGLYFNIYHKTGMSIKVGALKVPTFETWTNWNEPLCPSSRGTALEMTNFINSLPNIWRWCLSKH